MKKIITLILLLAGFLIPNKLNAQIKSIVSDDAGTITTQLSNPTYLNVYTDQLNQPGPAFDQVEMLGTSVAPYNWFSGVDLSTTDGIIYTLSNYSLPTGEVKFRLNHDWGVNWGNYTFPTGIGVQGGPNIPVETGIYDISFNRNTGEYNFQCIAQCPIIISIIGTAVYPGNNWYTDFKLGTTDGINYTSGNTYLSAGELRFRQDFQWSVNWGGYTFPSGTGNQLATNIEVPSGVYDISFNRITGEYNFLAKHPGIGLIGTALDGWFVDDLDLQTTDDVIYTLNNHHFNTGEAKFRQDNSWAINWGNTSFPYGYGYNGGPNIPIPEGNYNVTFNRLTGEYSFAAVCADPVLICPADINVNAFAGTCGATVYYDMPVPADNCGQPYVFQFDGLPSGSFFPVGVTTNSFVLYNSIGRTAFCSFTVTVSDNEKPVINQVSVTPSVLWPPNHKMNNVTVNYSAWDNCGNYNTTLSVSSNEPVNGTGDGDTAPDWIIVDNHHLQLRAERAGAGKGRIYTISITATDASGNTSVQQCKVTVPQNGTKNMAKGISHPDGEGFEDDFRIIPNPSSGYFTLMTNIVTSERIELKLMDVTGRLISTMNATGFQPIRFGDQLKPGLYFAQITRGKYSRTLRIIKQ